LYVTRIDSNKESQVQMESIRPVSWRWHSPEVEAAIGLHGVAIDYLSQCYQLTLVVNGVPLSGEVFFTDCPNFLEISPIDIYSPWESEKGNPCNPRIPTTGYNPCEYDCVYDPQPIPDWDYPLMLADSTDVLSADVYDDNDIWWY